MAQLPMYQRIGVAAYKKDLSNTLALCEALGEPQTQFPSIHIAGTNGKGSTTHFLGAILQAAGYKTGFYTSPHYKDFRERIKINGEYISEEAVMQFFVQQKAVLDTVQPSFFEMTVALCFDYFAQQKVDIAVIEVGLGGRLDSTNILSPILSIITNISLDHQAMLGNTLTEIAREKAGIIKPNTPVVISETQEESLPVFQDKAYLEKAPLCVADQNYLWQPIVSNQFQQIGNIVDRKTGKVRYQNLAMEAGGVYQQKNILGVLQAVDILRQQGYAISEEAVRKGLSEVKALTRFQGRWQVIQAEHPIIIADSGHNEGGLQLTMKAINELPYQQLHFVLGVVNDKDLYKMFELLPQNALYYFAKADIPRGLDAHLLQEQAAQYGLKGATYPSVSSAFQAAKLAAAAKDMIFIGGSCFTVAEVI